MKTVGISALLFLMMVMMMKTLAGVAPVHVESSVERAQLAGK